MKRINFITLMISLVGIFAMSLGVAFAEEGGLTAAPGEAGPDVVTIGGGYIRGALFAAADDVNLTTTSTTFVPVPGMTVSFNAWAPAIIQYCAFVWANNDAVMFVEARVDGVAVPPGAVQFTGDTDEDGDGAWARSHCFNFVSTDMTIGNHTVGIWWRSFDGQVIWTHKRSLVVWSY